MIENTENTQTLTISVKSCETLAL